jgi:hypothetical protein
LVEAKIANAGVADSLLKASHCTRTRHAHQVTACALYNLQQAAFAEYPGELEFAEWYAECMANSPQFQYWHIALKMELLVLQFVRSLREGKLVVQ